MGCIYLNLTCDFMKKREYFSYLGFIFAAIGSAVGLGNIWRFPYIVGSNGGGSFLIAYVIAIIFMGAPLMLLELSVGKHYKESLYGVYKRIKNPLKYIALISLFITFIVTSYYLVVNGWSIAYAVFSVTGYPEFDIFANSLHSFVFFFIALTIVCSISLMGIKKGIEKFVKIVMPLMFLTLIGLAIYAISLPGFGEAIRFYLYPDFSALLNIKVWIMAFGQALFSLSLGMGIMLTYSSHFNGKISKPAIWIIIADSLVALISGFIIFPIAFSFNIPPSSGSGLVFKAFPLIFNQLGAGGTILGLIFFTLLAIAAITSAISLLEVIVESVKEALNISRVKVILGISTGLLAFGGVFALNKTLLEEVDFWFGTVALIVQSLMLIIILAWIMDFNKIKHEFYSIFTKVFYIIGKYITPLLLIIMLFFVNYI